MMKVSEVTGVTARRSSSPVWLGSIHAAEHHLPAINCAGHAALCEPSLAINCAQCRPPTCAHIHITTTHTHRLAPCPAPPTDWQLGWVRFNEDPRVGERRMRLYRDDLQPTAWALFHFRNYRVPAFMGAPTVAEVLEQLYPEWEGGRMDREAEVEARWVVEGWLGGWVGAGRQLVGFWRGGCLGDAGRQLVQHEGVYIAAGTGQQDIGAAQHGTRLAHIQ